MNFGCCCCCCCCCGLRRRRTRCTTSAWPPWPTRWPTSTSSRRWTNEEMNEWINEKKRSYYAVFGVPLGLYAEGKKGMCLLFCFFWSFFFLVLRVSRPAFQRRPWRVSEYGLVFSLYGRWSPYYPPPPLPLTILPDPFAKYTSSFCYRVLPGFLFFLFFWFRGVERTTSATSFIYRVSLGYTGFLLSLVKVYWVLLGIIEYYWGFYWGFIGFYWVWPRFTQLNSFKLDSIKTRVDKYETQIIVWTPSETVKLGKKKEKEKEKEKKKP